MSKGEEKSQVAIADDAHWEELFADAIQKVPFSTLEWRELVSVISDLKSDSVIVFYKNKPIAGINIYYRVKGGRKYSKHPAFTPYNTIIFSKAINSVSADEKIRLTTLLADFIKSNYIYPYFLTDVTLIDLRAFQWSGYKVSTGYTFLVDPFHVKPDPDIVRRARKCGEEGFYCKEELNADIFYNLVKSTTARQSIRNSISLEQIKVILEYAGKFAFGITSYDAENSPLASWIQMGIDNRIYNWNAASDSSQLAKGGSPFVVMKLLELLKNKGTEVWDLCGADHPSVARFKGSIGGVLTPYFKVDYSDYPLIDKIKYRF